MFKRADLPVRDARSLTLALEHAALSTQHCFPPSPFTHSRHHDLIVSTLDDVRRQSSRRGLRSKRGVVLLNNNSSKGVCPGGPLCRGTILPDRALTLNL